MTTKYKRRTFKQVADDAYKRGLAEGADSTKRSMFGEFDRMVEANHELRAYATTLEERLADVSLRKLAWSRLTGLFKREN
jgi:hypothetical protein